MIEVVEDLGKPRRLDPLGFIEAHYPQIRRYAPAMLEEFDFQAAPGGEDVLAAIELLREMNATGKRKLPKDAPTSFVAAKWEPFVRIDGGLDRRYYELCALSSLRDHLRSGDIWVPGSRQYQDFERYLLGPDAFAALRAAGEAPVAVETDFDRYMAERSELLTDRLDEVHGLIEAGELNTVEITRDGFSIKPYRGTPWRTDRQEPGVPQGDGPQAGAAIHSHTDRSGHLRGDHPEVRDAAASGAGCLGANGHRSDPLPAHPACGRDLLAGRAENIFFCSEGRLESARERWVKMQPSDVVSKEEPRQ